MAKRKKTDFVDDDLIRESESVKEVKLGPGHEPVHQAVAPDSDVVPVHELNLTPLTKKKEEINGQVASKVGELERLRARQRALEQEKDDLEHLRRDQEQYEGGKREMADHLQQYLVSLDREEILLSKRLELLIETKKRFREMAGELRNLKEDEWPDDSKSFREELNKALTIVENTRKDYHKAVSRLEATRASKGIESKDQSLFSETASGLARPRNFGDWLIIGVALSLPVVLVLIALIVFLLFQYPVI